MAQAAGSAKLLLTEMEKTLGKEQGQRRKEVFGLRHKVGVPIPYPSGRAAAIENARVGISGKGEQGCKCSRKKKLSDINEVVCLKKKKNNINRFTFPGYKVVRVTSEFWKVIYNPTANWVSQLMFGCISFQPSPHPFWLCVNLCVNMSACTYFNSMEIIMRCIYFVFTIQYILSIYSGHEMLPKGFLINYY